MTTAIPQEMPESIRTCGDTLRYMNHWIALLDPRATKQLRRVRHTLVRKWLREAQGGGELNGHHD